MRGAAVGGGDLRADLAEEALERLLVLGVHEGRLGRRLLVVVA
jgi:hypothetical protein